MKKISIIIPNYNHNKYLLNAVESALRVKYNKEIIVVDDCSEESPRELLKGLDVTFVQREKNGGLSAARNTGIKIATGTHIFPLDADDELKEGALETLMESDADIVYGDLEWWSGGTLESNQEVKYEQFLINNQLFAGSLYKKEVWDVIGGYCEDWKEYYEDWYFWGRASKAGFKFEKVNVVVYRYRGEPDGMCSRLGKNRDYNLNLVIENLKLWERKSQ